MQIKSINQDLLHWLALKRMLADMKGEWPSRLMELKAISFFAMWIEYLLKKYF